jgi:hypothetical protein
MRAAASICGNSASMKTLVMMPASARRPTDHILQAGLLSHDIEAAFGGDFVASFRHQHGHFRLERTGNADHFIGRRHFKIELDLCQLTQATDIGILYVTTIFAQMHGNAIGATEMGFNRPTGSQTLGIGFVIL